MTLTLKSLATGYRRGKSVEISRNLNAELTGGTFACLIGPNGTGKSTLLRTLCGFISPLSGEVTIMGDSVTDCPPRELARLVSVVLTERSSMGLLTVRELVSLGRSPYSGFWEKLSAEDEEKISESIKLTGIEGLQHRAVDTLSDGERQRAFIAKALAQDTPLLLLDEASAFLDYPSKFKLFRLLREISHNNGKTILFSTHDMDMALRMADMLWVMDQGHNLHTGSAAELAQEGVLTEVFARDGLRFNPETMTFSC